MIGPTIDYLRVELPHRTRLCLGVNFTAAHSPTTVFRISISKDLRPSVRSNCRIRQSFSVSAAAALLPPSAALAPCSASSYQEFLTLWKDADPDIPILKQAKAEYAKLQ